MIDLDELTSRSSVSAALRDLKALSDRPISVKHTSEWVASEPGDPFSLHSAAYLRTPDRDEVYVGDDIPEHMAVHELIHPILWAEGYPDVRLVQRPGLRYSPKHQELFERHIDGIRDSLEHHEVHRRMRDTYGLDMAPYFTHKAAEHSLQLDGIVANVSREIPFFIQKEIIDVLELLAYRDFFRGSLEAYRQATPLAFSFCEQLLEQVTPVGFSTPDDAQRCYEMIRTFLVELGIRVGMNESENDLWRALDFPLVSPSNGPAEADSSE